MKNSAKHNIDKTNAMRILDTAKVEYIVHEYESDGFMEGEAVANKLGEDMNHVFKTIVLIGNTRENFVAMVPVDKEIDFKKVAKVFGVKSVEMIKVDTLTKITGYVRGGCSPIGMKKRFKTVVDASLGDDDRIIMSGGKLGMQIEMNYGDLIKVIDAKVEHITMN